MFNIVRRERTLHFLGATQLYMRIWTFLNGIIIWNYCGRIVLYILYVYAHILMFIVNLSVTHLGTFYGQKDRRYNYATIKPLIIEQRFLLFCK